MMPPLSGDNLCEFVQQLGGLSSDVVEADDLQLTYVIADGWCKGDLALHVHLRVRTSGIETQSDNLCLALYSEHSLCGKPADLFEQRSGRVPADGLKHRLTRREAQTHVEGMVL